MKPLTQQQLIRAEWLRALREQPQRQCHGLLWEPSNKDDPDYTEPVYRPGGKVCALGVLWEMLVDRKFIDPYPNTDVLDNRLLVEYAGLDMSRYDQIIEMNDYEEKTFAQIADEIEKWDK
jgi:hypothetical protein